MNVGPATHRERNAARLDLVEKNGRLIIGRGPATGLIGRIVICAAIGLLGLIALGVGADAMMALSAFALFVGMGIVVPAFIVRQHRQAYNLELIPEGFALTRYVGRHEETVHRATWVNVRSVETFRIGNQPGSVNIPSVLALGASGTGRRSEVRTPFGRELRGERISLHQPLAIGRRELVGLLTDAKNRFDPSHGGS